MRRRKYGNVGVLQDGAYFDSLKEARRGRELELLAKAGLIRDLRRQVSFELVPAQDGERPVRYVADFVYVDEPTGSLVVEDVKSPATRATPQYVIKRKLMLFVHKLRVSEL